MPPSTRLPDPTPSPTPSPTTRDAAVSVQLADRQSIEVTQPNLVDDVDIPHMSSTTPPTSPSQASAQQPWLQKEIPEFWAGLLKILGEHVHALMHG